MPQPCHQIRVHDRRSGVTSEHRFTATCVRIGRDPACELHLPDPFVSAQHALLEADERGARLRDLGGTNGLRVAGRRLAPHTAVPFDARLRVSLGPFDLDIVHTQGRDRRVAHGALDDIGPDKLDQLHARLRQLRALHTPFVAARQAFEAALADALHTTDDPASARRLLSEFPPEDHAHLVLPDLSTPRPTPHAPPQNLSQGPATINLSQGPAATPRPPDPEPPNLSQGPANPNPAQAPALPPNLSQRPATTPPGLQLIAAAARDLLPLARPPASLDEARRFLARLVDTTRDLATGLTALQHLRRLQISELGLSATADINPLLGITSADELLAELLAHPERHAELHPERRTELHTDRRAELLDCFAVLTAHARAHTTAALAAARHLAAELAPPVVIRHAAPGLLRTRARWRSYLDRHAACLGDQHSPGSLRTSFRAAYLAELDTHIPPA